MTIRNAYAAYAPHGSDGAETIYINSDWFAEASTEASVPLLLEEIGHALDQRLSP